MPTIKELKEHLKYINDDTPCCYALWLPADVVSHVEERMPEDAPVTAEEIEETLTAMQRRHDCTIGLTWDTLEANLPESVTDRFK